MGSKKPAKRPARRGPKTAEGRLAVRLNASRHGILSPEPVVNAYERAEDWEAHREAVVGSLSPEGGMEGVLAERVALCSWRLNRVVLYESEGISALQEGALEAVREGRKRRLELERLLAKPGERVLTDLGILIEAHPLNALDDAETARLTRKTVEKLSGAPADAPVKGPEASVVLALAAEEAVRLAARREDEGAEGRDVAPLAEALLDRLPGVPDGALPEDSEWTVGRLRGVVGWLAVEAGREPGADAVEGSAAGPEEALMEALRTHARYDAMEKEAKAEEVETELLAERRDRILPGGEDLQKIARYEAHLSRQMYQALHELEALQSRRRGAAAPLARVDVQT
jgi:hypothetical protein